MDCTARLTLNVWPQLMPEKSGFVSANTLYLQSQRKMFITTGSERKWNMRSALTCAGHTLSVP